ncbi:MAG TPA: hypothetical protein VN679_01240 [Candidatus Acidoferrales bacterium]|jgi:hypothetical protein|nr:hypothetical protein [Candidatus Acidoferrales bacterium]
MIDISTFHSSTFSGQLHTDFTVQAGNGTPLVLKLVEVVEKQTPANVELFTLHFHGPASLRLVQQIHTLQHDKLGTFQIFLTAVEGNNQTITYEAVFHRLRQS